MSNPMRHLPPLALAAILLCALSCGTDEPRGRDNGTTPVPHDTTHRNDTTPTDTTHHNTTPNDTTGNTNPADTTHHGNNDTTTTFSITLNAPRDYGYMGQTLQLNAVTSAAATVSWHSSNSAVATVDASGLVCFNNIAGDGTTVITATASGVSDQVTLTNRCWTVAAWNGTGWDAPSYFTAHPGDTIALTITDSQSHLINDSGFNAAACQWTVTSRNADVASIVKTIAAPTGANNWQYRLAISHEAPAGAIMIVTAQHGDAASALSCVINP